MHYSFKKIVLLAASGIACFPQVMSGAAPKDDKLEAAVEKTLSRMTLEEKIGQMTELSIDVIGEWKDGKFQLDEKKLHTAISQYKVGSILNAPGPVAQTPETWEKWIGRSIPWM